MISLEIIDRLPFISLADLRNLGMLTRNSFKSVSLEKKLFNGASYSLQVSVSTLPGKSFVELEYQAGTKPIKYRIPLVKTVNPFTNNGTHYFYCPMAGQKCRKLYLNGFYFTHRSAIENGDYFMDTLSKKQRSGYVTMKMIVRMEKKIAIGQKRYFKTHYAGMPTRKYLKVRQATSQLSLMAIPG